MLAWLVEEVKSPYGTVATLHWAVPDEAAAAGDHDNDNISGDRSNLNTTALQVELESAEDQLGAVLWNSNPAALSYLHAHVFGLLPTPSKEMSASGSGSAHAPLAGKNVVELGAGVGCLGIALAMGGARVAVTDMKELLPLMAHNVRLNERRVQTRSHGMGYCAALPWKWGPTVTTSVHKQMQKEMKALTRVPPHGHSTEANAKSSESSVEAAVERVMLGMVESLEKPSDSLVECSSTLKAAAGTAMKSGSSGLPYHYVVMCDALYGNPKDWPALLYTLTELLCTNPDGCEVVNFCEQRVNDVEGAFLKMLDEENERVYVPASQRDAAPDPLWTAVKESALRCSETGTSAEKKTKKSGAASSEATSAAPAAEGLHKAREEAAAALLSYVLVQRRGRHRWAYRTEVVAEAQSELNMVIRATRIRWTRVETNSETDEKKAVAPVESRRRPRDAEKDAQPAQHMLTAKKKKH